MSFKKSVLFVLFATFASAQSFAGTVSVFFQENDKLSLTSIDVVTTETGNVSYVMKMNGNFLKTLGSKNGYSSEEILALSEKQNSKIGWDKTKKYLTIGAGAIIGGALDVLIVKYINRNDGGTFKGLGEVLEGLVFILPSMAAGGYLGYKASKYLYATPGEDKLIALLTSAHVIASNKNVILNEDAMLAVDQLDTALKTIK